MKLHFVSVFLLASFLLELSTAGRIVIVPPIMFDSHLYVFMKIAVALNNQGHEVTLVLSEGRQIEQSSQFQIQQYHGIFNSKTADEFLQEKMKNIFAGKLTSLELFTILEKYVANCDLMVGNAELIQQLKALNFDLLLIDPNEMCGYILAHMLGVKYAVVSTGLWFPAEVGAPAPVAYVPEFNSLQTDRMTFMGRTWNTVVYIISRIATHFVILPKFEAIIRKHAEIPQMSMMEIIHETSLFFLCNDFALEFSRPLLPNVVFVGGILTAPAKPLPEDLLSWVEGGKAGLVVVSFGIGIRHLPEDLAEKMAAAFSRLPQRVIWRYFGQKPRNLGNNTKTMEWLPQNDLLGHPSTKVFVSHCGLNGIFESIYHGVPVVGIPFYGDQYDIMTRIQANGMGILLDWSRMTEEDLYQALSTVITDPRYKNRAAYISTLHHDQPQHALNRTVYWIEYLLRYDGARHLRPASLDIPFYQYYLLDVLAFFGLLTALIVYLLYKIVKIRKPPQRQYQNGYMNGYCYNGYLATEVKKIK
ncbi:2-hydroxyacylsphingosine 1-beta-galactosyltransferase-like isoform X2 [Protopterus annectens]|nr:2-hydroxyacylsphingosine 1-beta-galactosyltransferase-like isoform X2 [Protopterus annectens]XP_043912543.1 2-hydroxyacylsphingosine 1-beta-galactosyltransferase-like isoform X2 [Protopterus annectens]